MLTGPQELIIRDVCSIQYQSLVDILLAVDLGVDESGEKYDDILKELEINRKELDTELIGTIKEFQKVHDNPELVFELGELDMLVFRHILFYFSHKWERKFPNALSNLWDKIFYLTVRNLNSKI